MRERFYQKIWFKNALFILTPVIISAIGIILTFVSNSTFKFCLCAICILLTILVGVAVLWYGNYENKIEDELLEVKKENQKLNAILNHLSVRNKAHVFTIETFSEFTESWSKNINTFVYDVKTLGKAPEKCWDKYKLFDSVCTQCRNMLKIYCNNNDISKISVGFISYWEDSNKEKWIHMVAHSNPNSTKPRACKEKEKLSDSIYHYADLIKDNNSDIEIAINNEEVLRIFKKVSKNTDLSKYSQYIAIPVYGTSKQLLGIFQIVTKYDYIINKNSVALREFAEEFIVPYSNLIVLIDKINSGLYVKP